MNTIHKYPIEIADIQTVMMPDQCTIIHAGLDPQGVPCIWAIVNAACDKREFTIAVIGTGNPMPSLIRGVHLGSFSQDYFMWHVFLS